MKKSFTPKNIFIKLVSAIGIFFSSTLSAQTIIYNEKFDGDSTALPTGWTTIGNAWHVETSNASTGYLGASGLVNVCIRNDSATGNYDLITKSISTIGYNSISVLWGARLTTNFPTTGSAVTGLYWSSNNGNTWNTLNYNENTNNSTWALDNAGMPIVLPASASNQASIIFKWSVSIVTGSQGTYRIDDFTVGGISSVGIHENAPLISSAQIFPNPSNAEANLVLNARTNFKATIEVFNVLGQQTGMLSEIPVTAGDTKILLGDNFFPVSGPYFIRVKTGDEIQTIRFIKN